MGKNNNGERKIVSVTISLSKTLTAASNRWSWQGDITVQLQAQISRVTHQYKKDLYTIPRYRSKSTRNAQPSDRKVVDQKRVTEKIILEGFLTDDYGGYNAIEKKTQIMAMAEECGDIEFVYRGEDFTGNHTVQIENMQFTDEYETVSGGDSDQIDSDIEGTAQIVKIEFKMTLLKGRERA